MSGSDTKARTPATEAMQIILNDAKTSGYHFESYADAAAEPDRYDQFIREKFEVSFRSVTIRGSLKEWKVRFMQLHKALEYMAWCQLPSPGALEDYIERKQAEIFDVFQRKNGDYGNAFATTGLGGVVVRMGDKVNRVLTLKNKEPAVVEETVKDTLQDLSIYALLALIMIMWEEEKPRIRKRTSIN
jgi:hypothetical protein